MAMDLIRNINWTASIFSNARPACFLRFQVPDCVVVLWVLKQLIRGHGRHGESGAEKSFTIGNIS